jgi:hypothetical protein
VDWYGPDDQWPAHSKDFFQKALKIARQAGWSFQKYADHAFGKVVCDRSAPPEARCEFPIYSSGSGAESAANELRSLVQRCPHGNPDQKLTTVQAVNALLDEADRLIEAVERCINADGMHAAVDELLGLASDATSSAAEALDQDADLLDQAVDIEYQEREERQAAIGLADAAGYPSSSPLQPEPLLDAASSRVGSASQRLGRSSSGKPRARARQRIEATETKISNLRSRL